MQKVTHVTRTSDLEQGSPTYGLPEMAGEYTHVCMHSPTHASAATWVLIAHLCMSMGANTLFVHECGCKEPICTWAWMLVARLHMHTGMRVPVLALWVGAACLRMQEGTSTPAMCALFVHVCAEVHAHIFLLLPFSLGCQPRKVGEHWSRDISALNEVMLLIKKVTHEEYFFLHLGKKN